MKNFTDMAEADRLVRKYSAMIYRIALIRTKSKPDAEDIMQEVFLRYLKYAPVFENDEHEKAWFIKTTINRTNSFFSLNTGENGIVEAFADAAGQPSEAEERGVIYAVNILPKNMRTVIYLFYYEDMTVNEISVLIGKSEAAVKTLLYRSREKLRQILIQKPEYFD